jgi:hypothetical protein
MAIDSAMRSPAVFERLIRSDPARSTSDSMPATDCRSDWLTPRSRSRKTMCDRDECSFMLVAAVARFRPARCTSERARTGWAACCRHAIDTELARLLACGVDT